MIFMISFQEFMNMQMFQNHEQKRLWVLKERKRKRKLQRAFYIRLDKTKWHLSTRELRVGIFSPTIECSMVLKRCQNMKTLYRVFTRKTTMYIHKKPQYTYDQH